jgi:ribosomal protein S17E
MHTEQFNKLTKICMSCCEKYKKVNITITGYTTHPREISKEKEKDGRACAFVNQL